MKVHELFKEHRVSGTAAPVHRAWEHKRTVALMRHEKVGEHQILEDF